MTEKIKKEKNPNVPYFINRKVGRFSIRFKIHVAKKTVTAILLCEVGVNYTPINYCENLNKHNCPKSHRPIRPVEIDTVVFPMDQHMVSAIATCDPKDTFDPKIGMKLSAEKLMKKIASRVATICQSFLRDISKYTDDAMLIVDNGFKDPRQNNPEYKKNKKLNKVSNKS